MYIREVIKGNKIVYRLVESYRSPNGPRQHTLLSLNELSLPKDQWKNLADIVEALLLGQTILKIDSNLHDLAEHMVSLIKSKKALNTENTKIIINNTPDYQNIDLNSVKHKDIRTIGAEHIAYSVYQELELDKLFKNSGFNENQRNLAALAIISRLVHPESENSTREWAKHKSGLDMLLKTSFSFLPNNSLYRISDKIYTLKETIEKHLVQKERALFNLKEKLVLFDLTNTYFEGNCSDIPKANFGRSKEKRSDCRLLTLGMIIDEQGFPKTCKIMEGNQSEPLSLVNMIKQLETTSVSEETLFKDKIVVIDAGISSEANLKYLKDNGYNYLCVSRNKPLSLNELQTLQEKSISTSNDIEIKVSSFEKEGDNYLYCLSPMKKVKEQSMLQKFEKRFIDELNFINESLKKKKSHKTSDRILERVGRLKEKHKHISRYFTISIEKQPGDENLVQSISWEKINSESQDLSFNGSYFLRTNLKDIPEQDLWSMYSTLTLIEHSFRCLKTELAFRPVYHQKEFRAESHLFIAVLAYHMMNIIRLKLKAYDINDSWNKIRETLSTHNIVTTEMLTEKGETISITQSSEPDLTQKRIYHALNIKNNPIEKMITTFQ